MDEVTIMEQKTIKANSLTWIITRIDYDDQIKIPEETLIAIRNMCQENYNISEMKSKSFEIGKDFFNANSLYELDNNSKCTIGNDCMFSSCHILAGDCHKIVDKITKKELNTESNLVVGDHVWIGYNATILKNAKISSGSIVGTNSLVAGKFDEEESVIIAENPARIIKKNIEWRK